MFQLLAYGLLLSPAVFPAAPRPAVAGAPTITQLQQRDNGIFVSWTADTVWDYYIVTYSLHNPRQGQASDRTPGGMQGADTIQPLPPYGTESTRARSTPPTPRSGTTFTRRSRTARPTCYSVSPERLNNPDFRDQVLPKVTAAAGLIVIDEGTLHLRLGPRLPP